jgi:hypothetical protein
MISLKIVDRTTCSSSEQVLVSVFHGKEFMNNPISLRRTQLRQRHRPLSMMRRYLFYRVPLLVAVGTTITSFVHHLAQSWRREYSVPRSSNLTVMALASIKSSHVRWWGTHHRLRQTNFFQRSPTLLSMQYNCVERNIDSNQINRNAIRVFSNIDEEDESWESDTDEENSETDESFLTKLEDINDDITEELARETTTDSTESESDDSIPIERFKEECERWAEATNRAISALKKKQFSLEKEFAKAEQLESLQTRGQYLQSY